MEENKIYVGNLPFNVTEKDLENFFSQFGKVTEVSIVKDRFSGNSKGFGFVNFEDKDAMEKAVSDSNGKDFQGRELKVSKARPKTEFDGPKRSFGNNRSFGGNNRRRF
jgi:RNA recognition motif-containing protein